MTSKVIVVTGASDGIGTAAARRLSVGGHRVVVVGRSPAKTTSVARQLGSDYYLADFTKLTEVHALADELLRRYPRIDVLVNNAGGCSFRDRRLTPDGHEVTFQVNYLAGFLLTTSLLDRLLESRGTVICTSSIANSKWGNIDVDDLDHEKEYSAFKAYGDSKLALILFARELHRRYRERGLAAAAFHPGYIASSFSLERGTALRFLYAPPVRHLWLTSPEKGSDTLVWLAEGTPGADFPSGEYFFRRKLAKPNEQVDDPALASRLWARSEAMVTDTP